MASWLDADWLFEESVFPHHFGQPFPNQPVIAYPEWPAAPRFLVELTNEMGDRIEDLADRASQLQDEIVSLRREWLRAVLIECEPALEHRRTTERRLQQRGLGPRPRPFFDEEQANREYWGEV